MSDPIADNQTETTINMLLTGRADNDVRDRATAALLSSVQKLTDSQDELRGDIRSLKDSLWSKAQIEGLVDERVKAKCRECPAKLKAEGKSGESAWKEVVMVLLKYGGWLILLLFGILKVAPPAGS